MANIGVCSYACGDWGGRGGGSTCVITLPGGKTVRGQWNRKEAGWKGLDVAGADVRSGWMEML